MIKFLIEHAELIKLVLAALTPILVITGWRFIQRNSHSFAKRTELNGIANDVNTIVDELLLLAANYWLTEGPQDSKLKRNNRLSYEMKVIYQHQKLFLKREAVLKYDIELEEKLLPIFLNREFNIFSNYVQFVF